jgi:hypothetical protein
MSNEKQQTVVDRIVNLLNKEGFAPVLTEEEIKSFKEMEKEQMIEFAQEVFRNRYNQITQSLGNIADDIYNETYGGNK